jgi:hypothetical protein
MRRPHTASSRRKNRTRIVKKGPGRRMSRRAGRVSAVAAAPVTQAALPSPVLADSAPAQLGCSTTGAQTSPSAGVVPSAIAERGAAESTRCGFGAVRVGPLLGRLRLHLQTERFLAVHRGDFVWQEGCAAASLALNEIVAGLDQAEFDAPLTPQHAQSAHVPGHAAAQAEWGRKRGAQGFGDGIAEPAADAGVITSPHGLDEGSAVAKSLLAEVQEPTLRTEGWGTRKTGTAALAACGAALARGAR